MQKKNLSATAEQKCSQPSCNQIFLASEPRKSSFLGIFRAATPEAATAFQGFSFGGQWYCSKECLKWAVGKKIGELFRAGGGAANLFRTRLGTILRAKGSISVEQLEDALQKQKEHGGKLGHWLVKLGYIPEDELITSLAQQLKISWIKRLEQAPNETTLAAVPKLLCTEFTVFPLEFTERSRLVLAVDCSFSSDAVQTLGDVLDCGVRLFLARRDTLEDMITKHYGIRAENTVDVISPGEDLAQAFGHCFVEKWFQVDARKARFGLFEDLLWIRYETDKGCHDHFVRLKEHRQAEQAEKDADASSVRWQPDLPEREVPEERHVFDLNFQAFGHPGAGYPD